MSVIALNDYITFNADGYPIVKGTRTKVVQIVMDFKGNGWTADEIHANHPYLSLAQIHAALVYYRENKEEIERDIERRDALIEQIMSETQANSIRPLLREKGVL